MSTLSKHHQELDENGTGKCSVPMWMAGMPAGFCDKDAYGKTQDRKRYDGFAPGLLCFSHGGPPKPKNKCINWPHNHAANGCG